VTVDDVSVRDACKSSENDELVVAVVEGELIVMCVCVCVQLL
jgi:hypothetical protein